MIGHLVLLLVWLALLGSIAVQWLQPPQLSRILAAASDPVKAPRTDVAPPKLASVASLVHYDEMVARPLFYPGRRPLAPEPKPTAAPPADNVKLTLIGVVVTDKVRIALIRQEDTHKVSQLSVGQEVADWHLEQIKPESVVLRRGNDTQELPLLRNQAKPSAQPRMMGNNRDRATSRKAIRKDSEKRLQRLLQQRTSS